MGVAEGVAEGFAVVVARGVAETALGYCRWV